MADSSRIVVIGAGGMANHVLTTLSEYNPKCTMLLVDTDAQALAHSLVRYKMLLGESFLHGLGTGRNVAVGRQAAARSIEQIRVYLNDADTVCLIAGLSGGSGSGAIQVISRYALDLGKRVVCFVSMPFRFEGKEAEVTAIEALRELDHMGVHKSVLSNQDLFALGRTPTFSETFKAADKAICSKIMELLEHDVMEDTPIALEVGGASVG